MNDSEAACTVALTAYGPFVRAHNSSMEVGRQVAALLDKVGMRVIYREIETSWTTFAQDLGALVDDYHPAAIISLGERPDVKEPVVELVAKNERHKNDIHGTPGEGAVVVGGPATRNTPEDMTHVQQIVREQGAHIGLSHDAGTYLCNAALYTNLGFREAGKVRHAGFIHVPSREENDPHTTQDAQAIADYIRELLSIS
ncbi:hypothetical protein CRES_0861 [Corynebacterium resistens DSM 45100]|uniref:Pyrrolidone-carboxylate peptidase n=1 Tax=Corynebacterium resistens (strain DSM 45100 / JCM 12819 / GTC 2026 / SICGH 158) TaxID=662755 RepID=F8E153_CORRG|nr:hypothetical protein [Corynebacterium resistens]AEI09217.1 hypothetical protein CRES_0861 [Corynebacterium resistens DSM 45100]